MFFFAFRKIAALLQVGILELASRIAGKS